MSSKTYKGYRAGDIPRGAMPQIKSSLRNAFLKEVDDEEYEAAPDYYIGHWRQECSPSSFKPSQANLVESNVRALMRADKWDSLRKPILVSQDGYVLDGHHRWEASRRTGRFVQVIVLGYDCADALRRMEAFAAKHPEECASKM